MGAGTRNRFEGGGFVYPALYYPYLNDGAKAVFGKKVLIKIVSDLDWVYLFRISPL